MDYILYFMFIILKVHITKKVIEDSKSLMISKKQDIFSSFGIYK